eukprot:TRINITY_DN38838_c4_g1_i1.p1 TRINITY_DN38838_c4_g1~~TRINITY_DN38838_c4_g1_i1.p1  ORF type:complete len:105 (+),score=5.99 TRINITY_DN38838_c4_g1_i1:83-397(+)
MWGILTTSSCFSISTLIFSLMVGSSFFVIMTSISSICSFFSSSTVGDDVDKDVVGCNGTRETHLPFDKNVICSSLCCCTPFNHKSMVVQECYMFFSLLLHTFQS